VTLLPDARFSSLSFATILVGNASPALPPPKAAAQWQSSSGQPHLGQTRPRPVE
jgi:hypothetical protein